MYAARNRAQRQRKEDDQHALRGQRGGDTGNARKGYEKHAERKALDADIEHAKHIIAVERMMTLDGHTY